MLERWRLAELRQHAQRLRSSVSRSDDEDGALHDHRYDNVSVVSVKVPSCQEHFHADTAERFGNDGKYDDCFLYFADDRGI
jgi:hypothetical protein